MPDSGHETVTPSPPKVSFTPALLQSFQLKNRYREIAPSKVRSSIEAEGYAGDEDALSRGLAIHKILELLCSVSLPDKNLARHAVQASIGFAPDDTQFNTWWNEANRVHRHTEFSTLFDTKTYDDAYNEVPVYYEDQGAIVNGIVDRIVIKDNTVTLIDYKTHALDQHNRVEAIAERYREQMTLYRRGVELLWPDYTVLSFLLFTHTGTLYKM